MGGLPGQLIKTLPTSAASILNKSCLPSSSISVAVAVALAIILWWPSRGGLLRYFDLNAMVYYGNLRRAAYGFGEASPMLTAICCFESERVSLRTVPRYSGPSHRQVRRSILSAIASRDSFIVAPDPFAFSLVATA